MLWQEWTPLACPSPVQSKPLIFLLFYIKSSTCQILVQFCTSSRPEKELCFQKYSVLCTPFSLCPTTKYASLVHTLPVLWCFKHWVEWHSFRSVTTLMCEILTECGTAECVPGAWEDLLMFHSLTWIAAGSSLVAIPGSFPGMCKPYSKGLKGSKSQRVGNGQNTFTLWCELRPAWSFKILSSALASSHLLMQEYIQQTFEQM